MFTSPCFVKCVTNPDFISGFENAVEYIIKPSSNLPLHYYGGDYNKKKVFYCYDYLYNHMIKENKCLKYFPKFIDKLTTIKNDSVNCYEIPDGQLVENCIFETNLDKIEFTLKLLIGIKDLLDNNYIHLNINPRSIIYTPNKEIIIIDKGVDLL